ncbi:hypothetical protein [Thiocapsa sp.]|uniref:hypothetical protein n=1 Tax=Thiocapsa sp. TaxID=2024551 RepID=UPI0035941BFF
MGPLPPFQVTVDTKGWFCVLDVRPALARHGPMLALPLVGGALDAAALAAAMSRYRPLILTLAEPSGDPPAICRLLAADGIDCRELNPVQSDPLRRELTPLLARSGALELCWTGLDLAVVHLVVPCPFLGDALADRRPDLEALVDTGDDGDGDVWQDARVFWYRLP